MSPGWSATPALLGWAAATALHPRLRPDLAERWGRPPAAEVGAIWVHAASVGEVGAAEALLDHLTGPVLLTADTDTGAARARAIAARRPGTWAAARPVDHPFVVASAWAEVRPRALVFVEGAWWPALAAAAREGGVPVVRAGARVGPRTRQVPASLYRRFARGAALVLARDDADADWFRAHQDAPVEVCGDLKLSGRAPAPTLAFTRPYVVGASTRAGDEAALLAGRVEGMQLVLAPRHPERWPEVVASCRAAGVTWARRTDLGGVVPDVDVILLDTIGELPGIVPGARAVFVGGTFDEAIGGHSAAEAARAGVPVVAGPHRRANASSFAAAEVVDADRPEDVGAALAHAVTRPRRPARSGAAALCASRLADLLGAPAKEIAPRPWASFASGFLGLRRRGDAVRVSVPVVAIGSENARGSGKTTTARWAAQALAARGHRVGVVLRGFGRSGSGLALSVAGRHAADLGDEGALFAADGHLVAAGPDRVASARALIAQGATVLVLDDGAHDPALAHDRRLLVVDARFPTGRGALPAGEGRAPLRGLTGVVVHHARPDLPYAAPGLPVAVATRLPGPWRSERGPSIPPGPVAAFAGIGRPADWLASIEVPVAAFRALPDHAPISERLARDLERWAEGRSLVCTDKDATRLPSWLRATCWWRGVSVTLPTEAESWLP